MTTLYDQDYYLWLKTTVKLLKQGKLSEVDVANLIEEIEDMGRNQQRAIYSNLKILLIHLLKYKYQPEKRSNSWEYTIEEHRQRIEEAFEDSPTLKNYLSGIFDECYQKAKKLAAKETGISIDTFPTKSPFTEKETLNPEYLPN